jgi:hypothetical protein
MTGSEAWRLVVLIVIVAGLTWIALYGPTPVKNQARPKPSPRPFKPRTPDDCPQCRAAHPAEIHPCSLPKPYRQIKSPRGSKKRIATVGFACPNPRCLYFGITDDPIHALVGCGHHGRQERIQDIRCQACRSKFSSRSGTVLYRLKTPASRVAEVLGALAEGVSIGAAFAWLEQRRTGAQSASPRPREFTQPQPRRKRGSFARQVRMRGSQPLAAGAEGR